MSHHKRTKKDVEDAYRRGFQDGFNVRPNPTAMLIRALWKKHEAKKFKKAWKEQLKQNNGIRSQTIGFIKELKEDENGLSATIELGGRPDA